MNLNLPKSRFQIKLGEDLGLSNSLQKVLAIRDWIPNPSKNIKKPDVFGFENVLRRLKEDYSKPATISDLQQEIKTLKEEVVSDRARIKNLEVAFESLQIQSVVEASSKAKEVISSPVIIREGNINYINKVFNHKWLSKITLKIRDIKLEIIALIDFGADQNVIREGIIPSRYFESTREVLRGANNQALQAGFKLPVVHICNKDVCFINTFLLIKDLKEEIILGTPFFTQLYPFTVSEKGISSQKFGKAITFEFGKLVTPKYASTIDEDIFKCLNRIERRKTDSVPTR